jgi:hypothetical protein
MINVSNLAPSYPLFCEPVAQPPAATLQTFHQSRVKGLEEPEYMRHKVLGGPRDVAEYPLRRFTMMLQQAPCVDYSF